MHKTIKNAFKVLHVLQNFANGPSVPGLPRYRQMTTVHLYADVPSAQHDVYVIRTPVTLVSVTFLISAPRCP